jgi:hypothetical protein
MLGSGFSSDVVAVSILMGRASMVNWCPTFRGLFLKGRNVQEESKS